VGSGRGYSFDSGVPKHLKPGKDMRYEQKSFTVKGAGNASIWRKCNHCDKDLLGEDSLAEHLVLQHNEPIGLGPWLEKAGPGEHFTHDGEKWVGDKGTIVNPGPSTVVDVDCPDDEGKAKRNQDFSLEG
jgi:hypothetical protein